MALVKSLSGSPSLEQIAATISEGGGAGGGSTDQTTVSPVGAGVYPIDDCACGPAWPSGRCDLETSADGYPCLIFECKP
ncbi:hypothetical protein PGTUg99_000122 [Puccinia graminis f. sp. tritici]|uniref:Uncharacterized protein n=1 Tax=Puccinia graminis f. sp. tritici TaxID=56615 RepID=A0A5B0SIU8_PUCGR|nr:hypothetical protein PGTUg99_000122 [Puccinia graminis f. sp. tritici]